MPSTNKLYKQAVQNVAPANAENIIDKNRLIIHADLVN